jgi:hypothetical protein
LEDRVPINFAFLAIRSYHILAAKDITESEDHFPIQLRSCGELILFQGFGARFDVINSRA